MNHPCDSSGNSGYEEVSFDQGGQFV